MFYFLTLLLYLKFGEKSNFRFDKSIPGGIIFIFELRETFLPGPGENFFQIFATDETYPPTP